MPLRLQGTETQKILSHLTEHCKIHPCKMLVETVAMLHFWRCIIPSSGFEDGRMLIVDIKQKNMHKPNYWILRYIMLKSESIEWKTKN